LAGLLAEGAFLDRLPLTAFTTVDLIRRVGLHA
jgi:hypothetical protein